jgi:hypothetical protein
MATLKSLMTIGALLVGTTSLAMAQAEGSSGPDGQLVSAGAADNPPALGYLRYVDPSRSSSRDTAPQNVHDVGKPHP